MLLRKIVTAFLAAVTIVPAAGAVTITTIDVPGAITTAPQGINSRGDMVGPFSGADGVSHGFLLSHGTFTTIDVPGVPQTFGCFGINALGDIVGSTIDSSGNDHGFLLSGGRYTTIDFPGAVATDLNDINPSGDIVGQYADSDGNEHGFILSK